MSEGKKRYWVYSALWRSRGEDGFRQHLTNLHVGSATSLYERHIKDPEYICIMSATEITADEYLEAKERGIIG